MNKESFVLYESTFKQVERLEKISKETAYDLIKAVCEFGLYGVLPEEDSNVWLYGFEPIITSIGAAKDRYKAAVENGKKGGRKKIELNEAEVMAKKQELKTWKAVAQFYGVSDQTLKNLRDEWSNNNNTKNPKNPKNLNDNVNDNDNVNSLAAGAAKRAAADAAAQKTKREATLEVVSCSTGTDGRFLF